MSTDRTVNQIIDLLSEKEKKIFVKWLNSSVTPRKKSIPKFFKAILSEKSPTQIWKTVFPDAPCPEDPFSSSAYRKLEFQLGTYLEEFLSIRTFLEDESIQKLYLIKALNNRKAKKLFTMRFKKIQSKIEKEDYRDESYFWIQHYLEREKQHYLNKQISKSKESIAPRINHSFDVWWMHEKLKIAINNLNHQHVTDEIVPDLFITEILTYVQKLSRNQYPVLQIYAAIYKTLTEEETEFDLYKIIYQSRKLFHKDSLKDIFTTILNYYGKRFNDKGEEKFLKELFDIYQWGIEDQLIFKDGELSWDYYKNLVTIGLRLKEYDHTLEIIEKYKEFLPKEQREEAYRFNLAQYYFTQGKFRQVIRLLNTKYSNVFYEIHARFLVLQSHYEMNNDADLIRNLRSLRIFISRQKGISSFKKNTEINRIKLFVALVKAFDKDDFQNLKAKILQGEFISNRHWLLEKVEQKLKKL